MRVLDVDYDPRKPPSSKLARVFGTHAHRLTDAAPLLRYFGYVLDEVDLGAVRDKLRELIPDAEAGAVATFAERILEEGREQGREQGRVEVLEKLLALRFGAVTDAQRTVIAAASPEQLDRFIERVLAAPDIDSVLA